MIYTERYTVCIIFSKDDPISEEPDEQRMRGDLKRR